MINENILAKIIPPSTREAREEFAGNEHIIDKLNEEEKNYLKEKLVEKLNDSSDVLIISTLNYLKPNNLLEIYTNKYSNYYADNKLFKLVLGTNIYKLTKNNTILDEILKICKSLDKYDLFQSFYYLKELDDEQIVDFIKSFNENDDTLLSYHSRKVLNMIY